MKFMINILLITCFLLMLAGCSNTITPVSQSVTSSVISTPTDMNFPTLENNRNFTPVSLPTLIATDLPSPTLRAGLQEECYKNISEMPSGISNNGMILYETHSPETIDTVSSYTFSRNETKTISKERLTDVSVSPMLDMFAVRNISNSQLEFYSSAGMMIKAMPFHKDWGNIYGWLDNETLLIVMNETEEAGSNFVIYPRSIAMLDIASGEVQILKPDYPDIDEADRNLKWYQFGTTVYSKDMNKVMYPGTMKTEKGDYFNAVILYDVQKNSIMFKIPMPTWYGHPPILSPDGSSFIIMGASELLKIDAEDGKSSKISNLNPLYDSKTGKGLSYSAQFYNWSPDSKKVAMWLRSYSANTRTLAILDVTSGIVVDTCISAGFDPNNFSSWPYPVWSPDSHYLVVAANYQPDNQRFDVLMVNPEQKKSYKLSSNLFPVGWILE